ncbi:MAG TPA: DeoR/GlpR family DNA-binding transcription regulator [Geminicoccus sp.]|uniref:DeoR/GlpR family DNA-binding transcription regulator n=1 Tax=Geminicoccus sp. TaxID=2024832 RepID=UPI002B6C7188|nr:DeoR/GlpR family DNA-binding transcription regulator [Geminicoccus sp.]HWL68764.1 DeoR/GlpR family DNA-binding transcription regulator [Geminicoccus sp.]
MTLGKQQRIAFLMEQVTRQGMIGLREVSARLGVSEMTVRRDVAAADGRLSILGGHILPERVAMPAGGQGPAQEDRRAVKIRACEWACSLIEPDDTLFVDCGSTLAHLARRLPQDQRLTVVCYSLDVAEAVARRPGIRMVLMGGLYHADSGSFEGDSGLATLRSVRLNKAFISAGGIHPSRGVSCTNFHEVLAKRAAMENALVSYLVADSSKFGRLTPAYFADLRSFAAIVTETGIAPPPRPEGG